MHRVRYLFSFAVTPGFLALAAVNFLQPSPLCTVPGPYGFLSSMWFMCLAMALAHSGPWLNFASRSLSRKSHAFDYRPSARGAVPDCCEASLREGTAAPAPLDRWQRISPEWNDGKAVSMVRDGPSCWGSWSTASSPWGVHHPEEPPEAASRRM